jgi:1,4-alpha-glucan branching enzyme
MPAKTEKQRKFMGAELARKREGKKTKTGMSEKKLEEFASKGAKKGLDRLVRLRAVAGIIDNPRPELDRRALVQQPHP